LDEKLNLIPIYIIVKQRWVVPIEFDVYKKKGMV